MLATVSTRMPWILCSASRASSAVVTWSRPMASERKVSLRSPVHFTGRPSARAAQAAMRVLGIEEGLHAEAAADVGREDPHLVGVDLEDCRPGCRVQSQPPWVQVCSVSAGRRHPTRRSRRAAPSRCATRRLLTSLSLTTRAALANAASTAAWSPNCQSKLEIARRVVMDQRLRRRRCAVSVSATTGSDVVLDADQLGRVLGLRERLGDHEGDVVADVADAVGAEHRAAAGWRPGCRPGWAAGRRRAEGCRRWLRCRRR